MTVDPVLVYQWLGAVAGISGSYLVGSQLQSRRFIGFLLFLVSNIFWILVSIQFVAWGLLVMNLAFMATSIRGCFANHVPRTEP